MLSMTIMGALQPRLRPACSSLVMHSLYYFRQVC